MLIRSVPRDGAAAASLQAQTADLGPATGVRLVGPLAEGLQAVAQGRHQIDHVGIVVGGRPMPRTLI
jgi:hypothetical protein